jgi:NADH-quinone oxidoreductase subunit G
MSEVDQLVTVTIDSYQVSVPKGTMVIRAAEQLGIAIPRFCDHPLLDPVGACRQCLVEIATPDREGNLRPMPKPQASCTIPVSPGMVVKTQLTSQVADKAQQGIMEFLLMNHPLDCPICDKGGECPLQNQAMSNGRAEARFDGEKRTYPKPLPISSQVLLDRERCVLCARCTRFSDQVAGDPFIELLERGALQQVGIYEDQPFESYFSGNTIQICPVGALTSTAYRFRARPFDLVSTPSACEHCASGCAQRTDHRRNRVMRRLAAEDPAVNEEWTCDKGRFAFTYATCDDRLTHPLVRRNGELTPASWPEALRAAADGLAAAAASGSAGVLTGGRVTVEDAYAYAKLARLVLGTNDIDFRARLHSDEEADFLAAAVAGTTVEDSVTYEHLSSAPFVLLAGFEPEEESPIVFLRLRKAVRTNRTTVATLAPFASRGTAKLQATVVPTEPGAEARVLADLPADIADQLGRPGAVLLVGERLAATPGGLSAARRCAEASGARLAWIPRRAGERGALDAGAFPTLLPGGRPITDAAARVDVAAVWGVDGLPAQPGRSTEAMLAAAASGDLQALLIGGVEAADLPDPTALSRATQAAFTVSLEMRPSEVHEHADVVFPVAAAAEKAGTFTDWEGRRRTFDAAVATQQRPDAWVLDALAAEMGAPIGTAEAHVVRRELDEIGTWDGARAPGPSHEPAEAASTQGTLLATWRMLLDRGRLQDNEPHLAGTAPAPVVRISPARAEQMDVTDGDPLTVTGPAGTITLPVEVTDILDTVVWLPMNSSGSSVYRDIGVSPGGTVAIGGEA